MPPFLSRLVNLLCASILLVAWAAHAASQTASNTAAGAVQVVAASPLTTAPAPFPPTRTPTASATRAPSNAAPGIPLKDALHTLEPQEVFENFYLLTQVPRPSGHMEQIRAFLVNFGQRLGLETRVDNAGNVLIRKPAAAGMENRAGVVLQAHMDMVPKTAEGKDFDFTHDPIQAYVNGDYIVADGTTLGADDGIGMAIIMAILQSQTLQLGPLEGLFTADEESDMSGANGLQPETLRGRTLINLDGEVEGTLTIGSAGGEHVNIQASYKQGPAPQKMVAYQVRVSDLQGGHSGVDINKGRGHATKLLVRLLQEALQLYGPSRRARAIRRHTSLGDGLRIASLEGGTVVNAIPTETSAVVMLTDDNVEAFTKLVQAFEATVKSELKATEPNLRVQLQAVQPPTQVMHPTFQHTLIDALYGTPQGVLRMSDTVPGLVETSTNLGITTAQEGQLQVVSLPRSSVNSELEDAAQMIASVWRLAGYQAEITDSYNAWTPNSDSPILELMQRTYKDLFGVDAQTSAVHAGLECGTIGGTYPDMDMISIGPTMENVHSVSERLYIPSVEKVMHLLSTVLQQIPVAQH